MKRIAVLTSGGDAPGLNACIRAIVRAGYNFGLEVWGIKRGYKGLIEEEFTLMSPRDVSGILDKGGTILLTSREPRFEKYSFRKRAYQNLKKYDIDGLFIIGGNGSFQGAYLLAKEFNFPVIAIPKTIDNDTYGTDYTIGFDTAINTAVWAISKIRDTTYSHERIFIVEVMGRKSGFIALHAGLASGADITLIPEYPYPLYIIKESIKKALDRGKKSILIVVAEGVIHARELALILREELGFNEDDIRYSVLGYIQRGGSPTAFDRIMASRFGVFAVEEFLKRKYKVMISYEKGELKTKPLEITFGKIKKPNLRDIDFNNLLSLW
ncbi:MAG: 6-phosphofructokinase [Aquificae bacterium]|nr:6-phosphofructokinase [Aquificota bacterium]